MTDKNFELHFFYQPFNVHERAFVAEDEDCVSFSEIYDVLYRAHDLLTFMGHCRGCRPCIAKDYLMFYSINKYFE